MQARGPALTQHPLSMLPLQQHGPPPGGPSGKALPARAAVPPRGPPPPKYSPGDRTHIPESASPIYNVLTEQLVQLKQTPQQKRMVDHLEWPINPLFDALNCETLSKPIVDQLLVLVQVIVARNRDSALNVEHSRRFAHQGVADGRYWDMDVWVQAVDHALVRARYGY
ncbi:hypothetical protein V8E55_006845 [Tylopilus felleus]